MLHTVRKTKQDALIRDFMRIYITILESKAEVYLDNLKRHIYFPSQSFFFVSA